MRHPGHDTVLPEHLRPRRAGRGLAHDGGVETDDLGAGGPGAGLAGQCPFTIDRPVMRQRWERLTFLHWAFEPAVVQRLLPEGLQVDTFGGAAWVGLVPFFMHVATGGDHGAPGVSDFCETNVRTYVRDGDGRAGIWFFSLDAARLSAVAVARATYRLPYFWSSMRVAERDGQMAYICRRRWPGPRSAASRVRISIGDRFGADELGERDHFLTARWVLFSSSGTWHRLARRAARALLVPAPAPAPATSKLYFVQLRIAGSGVRRGKAELSRGGQTHPATAPAGRHRSSHGGNEGAEAFG